MGQKLCFQRVLEKVQHSHWNLKIQQGRPTAQLRVQDNLMARTWTQHRSIQLVKLIRNLNNATVRPHRLFWYSINKRFLRFRAKWRPEPTRDFVIPRFQLTSLFRPRFVEFMPPPPPRPPLAAKFLPPLRPPRGWKLPFFGFIMFDDEAAGWAAESCWIESCDSLTGSILSTVARSSL